MKCIVKKNGYVVVIGYFYLEIVDFLKIYIFLFEKEGLIFILVIDYFLYVLKVVK